MAQSTAEASRYLQRLDHRLRLRGPNIEIFENYYEGKHKLQFATSRFRDTFGNLFREFADNWCGLVVDASVERLIINGFRTGTGGGEDDTQAAEIWTDNVLDAEYRIAHTEAVKLGHAYTLVDPEGNKAYGTDSPLVTIEHPTQAVVAHDPANPRHRLAGLKEWIDEDGYVCATVYLPEGIYRYQSDRTVNENRPSVWLLPGQMWPTDFIATPAASLGLRGDDPMWVPRRSVPFYAPNRLGVVPLIPLRNNPTMKVGGRSDIQPIIPIQDGINKLLADMLIASEFASFAQRWVTGIEIPRDPTTGRAIRQKDWLASAAAVWAAEDPDTKFGQFQASDLKNYVNAIEMLIQHVAAISRTPPHYLLGQSGSFPSGDSLTATETGLVAKVNAKKTDFSPTWNETMRLALKLAGSEKAKQPVQTVWADAEQRIRSQRIDGAMKMSTLGVPQDALWEEMQATPEQITRWHEMKKSMGQDPHSTEFAVPPPLPAGAKPPNEGPEGNLVQQQAATQTERVARI